MQLKVVEFEGVPRSYTKAPVLRRFPVRFQGWLRVLDPGFKGSGFKA